MANQAYASLKQYILRKLGSPVINIEITDDQLEDCIDDALDEYHENHFDGTFIYYMPFTLTIGQTVYQLDDYIQTVVEIMTADNLAIQWKDDDPLLVSQFYVGNTPITYNGTGLVDVEVFRQNFQMFADYFDVPIHFDFNSSTHKLYLATEPTEDTDVFLKVFRWEDDEVAGYLSDKWVKKYATALARLQWGDNLSKFEGGNLPGGATFNYGTILERAQSDIEKLQEELEDALSLPLDPEIG